MTTWEIRDPDEARRFLSQSLWLQSVASPSTESTAKALAWTLELASGGEPIPPIGVIADIGNLLLARGGTTSYSDPRAIQLQGWPAGLTRRYEDQVLGKLETDPTMARASDSLARLQGRDRDRGLAFVIGQFRLRAGYGGVLLSPAALKSALERPRELLDAGWESLASDGPILRLVELYEGLIVSVRAMHDILGPEDVFELEHGTALAAFGQRVALRQVLQTASDFVGTSSLDRPRPLDRRHDVATQVMDEDTYPVGGFSSISNRGSIESLLHSQLAYMEPLERPDLFDIKFARDELLYYSRDENQFLRRRRSVMVFLYPDLELARIKEAEIPFQRIILLLGLLSALFQRLTDWLTEEALVFEFLFVRLDSPGPEPLEAERELLTMLFREAIANGAAIIDSVDESVIAGICVRKARRSLCQALAVSFAGRRVAAAGVSSGWLRLASARPELGFGETPAGTSEAEDALTAWRCALDLILASWA